MLRHALQFVDEVYLTTFTIFFRVGAHSWTPGINRGKGVAGVTCIQAIVVLSIASWIDILAGSRFLLNSSKWATWLAYLVLCLPNYYALVVRHHGTAFESKFSSLNQARKFVLVVSSVLAMMATLGIFIWSAHAHRRFVGVPEP